MTATGASSCVSAHREGFEEGLAKGIEKGIEEEKTDIARTMKVDGLPVETIVKNTGRQKR